VTINSHRALALFDSGSTADLVSPDFARVANLPLFVLEKPVPLQLGCVGSRSSINFGTEPTIQFGGVDRSWYFDIANIDRYDVIIGTPFLSIVGIILNFRRREIASPHGTVRALLEGEEPRLERAKVKRVTEDIPRLRENWYAKFEDIMNGTPSRLPPMREVNHTIPLIDEEMKYRYHLSRCPEALQEQLKQKIARYVEAGWWGTATTAQAAPLLCIPK
ncbi:hypothetical protein FA95DRAFT_1463129, partial [Auriscalpium vulgare]